MGGKLRASFKRSHVLLHGGHHFGNPYEALDMEGGAAGLRHHDGDEEAPPAVARVPSAHELRDALRAGDAAAAAAAARAPPRNAGAPKAWRRVNAAGENTALQARTPARSAHNRHAHAATHTHADAAKPCLPRTRHARALSPLCTGGQAHHRATLRHSAA
jgi:hypothetical protein